MKKVLIYISIGLITALGVNQINWIDDETVKNEKIQISTIINNSDSLVCILRTDKRVYRIGERPEFQVEIINKKDSPITLIGSLDKSDIGFRLPICRYLSTHKIFGEIDIKPILCGNTNPAREKEFITVNPGSTFNPYQKLDEYGYFSSYKMDWNQFIIPGTYKIKFLYSTIEDEVFWGEDYKIEEDSSLVKWYYKNGNEELYLYQLEKAQRIDSLWNLVPKIKLESNQITIQYKI